MTQRTLRSEAALRHRLLVAACLALLVMPLCGATASVHPLAAELLHYLGFKPGDRGAVLEKGGVLQSGLTADEHFPEEVAAVGAMLLVNAVDAVDADAVIDAFLHVDTFHRVHQVTRFEVLGADTANAFANFRFSSAGEVERIRRDPLKILNLSASEATSFRSGGSGSADPISQAMAQVLAKRLGSFISAGIAGIEPYQRAKRGPVRPDRELESALRSLALLADDYPGFLDHLRQGGPMERGSRSYFRLDAPFQGVEVVALSSEVRQQFPDRAIGADLHFYASQGYNSMLTLVGVVPYDQRWLVFAINHTFTDEVLGFLFVLALLILVKGSWRLVGTITAFTLAHSITLAAATLGFVSVPGPPVEAVIALSIVFVACEIVHRGQGRSGLTERWPWVVAFTFGLLHGFGFAGALHEVGLPQNAIPLALLFFNVGVELGQLLFVASVMAALTGAAFIGRRLSQLGIDPKPVYAASESAAAYAIGSVAAFWLIERTLGFLT